VQIGVMFIFLGDDAQTYRIGSEVDKVLIKMSRGELAKFLLELRMVRLGDVSKCNFPLQ
jgi:hypothetical protein